MPKTEKGKGEVKKLVRSTSRYEVKAPKLRSSSILRLKKKKALCGDLANVMLKDHKSLYIRIIQLTDIRVCEKWGGAQALDSPLEDSRSFEGSLRRYLSLASQSTIRAIPCFAET